MPSRPEPALIERGSYLRQDESSACGVEHESLLLGGSTVMTAIRELIARYAPWAKPVLITGDTGSGKELVAAELHRRSGRSNRCVNLNCATIPSNLAESTLFGHEAGAFSGADRAHIGYFERADGGTLFLDEIGELSLDLQPKLLRALETGIIVRVGGEHERTVSVRVVAATNRDVAKEVRAGRFRADLYFRLNGLPLRLPPLAERLADIPLLVTHFLGGCLRPDVFDDEAIALLSRAAWPGNVRELRSVVELAAIVAAGAETSAPATLTASAVRAALEMNVHEGQGAGRELIARGIHGCVADGDVEELAAWMEDTLLRAVHEAEGQDLRRTAARLAVCPRTVRRALAARRG